MRFSKYIAILFAVGVFFVFTDSVSAATWNICGATSETCQFTSIAGAMASSSVVATDTVTVKDSYNPAVEGDVLVKEGIVLTCDAGATVGSSTAAYIMQLQSNVRVHHCNFSGINIDMQGNSSGIIIEDNTFEINNTSTIRAWTSDNFIVRRNNYFDQIEVGSKYLVGGGEISSNIVEFRQKHGSFVAGVNVGGGSTDILITNNQLKEYYGGVLGDPSAMIQISDAIGSAVDNITITTNTISYLGVISAPDTPGADYCQQSWQGISIQAGNNINISGNYITMPENMTSNCIPGSGGIVAYFYPASLSAVISHNTVRVPSTCEGCMGLSYFSGTNDIVRSGNVTSTYNIFYRDAYTPTTTAFVVGHSDVTSTMAAYEDYNGYYNFKSATTSDGAGVLVGGGHSLTFNPFFISTVTSSADYLHLKSYSNYLNIDGAGRCSGAYSTARASQTINVGTTGDFLTVASSTDALRSGDTLNLLGETFGSFTLTSNFFTADGITVQGQGASTIINAGASQSALTLNGLTNSTIKNLVVQNASSTVSSYTITRALYKDSSYVYDQSAALDTPASSTLLLVSGSSCQTGYYNADGYDISSLIDGSNNWHLALASIVMNNGAPAKTTFLVPGQFGSSQGSVEALCTFSGEGFAVTTTIDYWVSNILTTSTANGLNYHAELLPVGVSMDAGITDPLVVTKNSIWYSALKLINSSGNTIENVTSTNSGYGIWFNGTSANNNVSSSVFSGNTYDIYSDATGNNNLKNSSFNSASSSIASTGSVSAYFKARGYVTDAGSSPIGGGVVVGFKDNSVTATTTRTTGVDSYTVFTDNLLAYTMTSSSPTSTIGGGYNPFTITASASSTYATTSISSNLDSINKTFTIAMSAAVVGNTAPSVTIPYPSFSTSGTGVVTVTSTVSDVDGNTTTVFVDFSKDGGATWASSTLISVTGTGSPTTSTGKVENVTSTAGGNAITFTWNTQTDGVTTTAQAVIRLTPYDGTVYDTAVTSSNFTIDNESPAVPAGFVFSAVTTSSIVFSWGDVAGANIYTVSSTATSSAFSTSATTSIFSGLSSNTAYTFKVLASDAYGNASAYSSVQTTTTLSSVPTAPTSITTSSVSTSSMTIGWTDNSSNETSFVLQKSTDNVDYSTVSTTAAGVVSVNVISLDPNTGYYFRVKATGADGDSAYVTTTISTYTSSTNPTSFVSTASTSAAISIQWSANSNPAGTTYQVSGDNGISTITTTNTSTSVTAPIPNTSYIITVKSMNNNGTFNDAVTVVDYTKAAVPGTPEISEVATSSLLVTWTSSTNPGTTIYTVLYSGGTVTTTAVTSSITGLTPNTNYQFQVKAENLGALGTYSAYSASSTPTTTTIPVDITLPAVSSLASSTLTVGWTDGINGGTPVYQISSPDNSFVFVTTTELSKALSGLTPSSSYAFTVKVQKPDSTYTTGVSAVATTTLAAIPTSLTSSLVSTSSLTLSWGNNNNPTSVIYRATGDNSFVTVTTVATSTNLTGLTINTNYTFTVTAQNPDGTYTSGVSTSVYTLPSAPTGLTATAASASQINLAWTAVTGATSYKVYSSADGYVTAIASPTTNSYSVTSLSASTAYTYKVSAVNTSGEGAQSDLATASTNATPVSSGGGGGGAPAAPAVPVTVVSPVVKSVFEMGMEKGVLIGNTHHQVTFLSFDSKTEVVMVQVKSTVITVPLKVGEERVIDTNLDNSDDLYLKLNSIDSSKKSVSLTMVSLVDLEFTVNYNFTTTNNQNTTLYFNSPDAIQMAISNSADFSATSFISYQKTKQWVLTPGNGLKTVYVKFRTSQGGDKVVSDSITLDSSYPPVGSYTKEKITVTDDGVVEAPPVTVPQIKPAFTRTLKVGSTGADVKALQTLLKKLGYFKFPNVTTYFGNGTKQSLINYQKANKLKQTGVVDAATLKYLNGQGEVVKKVVSEDVVLPKLTFTRTLKVGSTGADVKALQTLLKKLGYFKFPNVTTYFGNGTKQSLINYQKANKLKQTGVVDAATLKYLNGQGGAVEEAVAVPEDVTEPVPTVVLAPTISTAESYIFSKYLTPGMTGLQIRYLQLRLQEMGYLSEDIKVNGVFGPATKAAVIKLQKDYNLTPATGYVGVKTMKVLNTH